MTSTMGPYQVRLLHEAVADAEDANVDVVVEFASGRRFGATFFTPENLERLMDRYKQSGECAQGLYVWASEMIVIRRVSPDAIRIAVADLIEAGEFQKAFRELM
jgi:hypothetical protein